MARHPKGTRFLPRRDAAHVGEDESCAAFFRRFCDPYFVVRPVPKDYGVDVELEALLDNGRCASNFRAHVQLKSTTKRPNADGSYSVQVKRSSLNYLANSPESLYVLYVRATDRLFYEWAIDVYEQHAARSAATPTIRLRKPISDQAVHQIWHTIVSRREEAFKRRFGAIKPAAEPSLREASAERQPSRASLEFDSTKGVSLQPSLRPLPLEFRAFEATLRRTASVVNQEGMRAPIDLRPSREWPARDQGNRGTAAVFALTACIELLEFESTGSQDDLHLSAEFLWWATKTQTADPAPHTDGTMLRHAMEAIESCGICREADFPYRPTGPVSDAAPASVSWEPSHSVQMIASERRRRCSFYTDSADSRTLYYLLSTLRRPVAISLPVFAAADSHGTQFNNWNNPLAENYGRVLVPPPSSRVVGGQAVCVTGYLPSDNKLTSGQFVVRNSWGTKWGRRLPTIGNCAPAPGYGTIPASYVDDFLWEMCVP